MINRLYGPSSGGEGNSFSDTKFLYEQVVYKYFDNHCMGSDQPISQILVCCFVTFSHLLCPSALIHLILQMIVSSGYMIHLLHG